MKITFVFFSDIERLQLKEKIANVTAKNAICKLKINETKREIAAEKEIGQNIDAITPVKFTLGHGIDESATAAIDAAIDELNKFDTGFSFAQNYEGILS